MKSNALSKAIYTFTTFQVEDVRLTFVQKFQQNIKENQKSPFCYSFKVFAAFITNRWRFRSANKVNNNKVWKTREIHHFMSVGDILRQKIFFESVSDAPKVLNINPYQKRQQKHRGFQWKEGFSIGKTLTQFTQQLLFLHAKILAFLQPLTTMT